MLNPSRLVAYAIWNKNFDKAKLTDELIDSERQANNDERREEAIEELIKGELANDYR